MANIEATWPPDRGSSGFACSEGLVQYHAVFLVFTAGLHHALAEWSTTSLEETCDE